MKKILIIQAARFGDLLQTHRLVKSLSARHEAHLAVDYSFVPLAKLLYPVATIHGIPFHSAAEEGNLSSIMTDFASLQKIDFYKIFNCNYSAFAVNLCRLFPEKKIIGLRPGCYSGGDILRSPWARLVFRLTKNRKITPLNLVDYWGWFSEHPVPGWCVNPEANPGGKNLGIVVAGQETRRSLPPDVLANIIITTANIIKPEKIFLLGTKNELPFSQKILRLLSAKILQNTDNLCGKTSWNELIRIVRKLELLLTPDTGTMHLAAFLGIPVMAFFLSSAWCHETAPYGKGHFIWQTTPICSPCLESASCKYSLKCLEPFKKESFSRYLAGALTDNKNLLNNLPPDLQLWKSDFNETGLKLNLIAGKDNYQSQREACWHIINNFLREQKDNPDCSPELLKEYAEELFPDSEWMLPKQRYC